jgi:hypothetical protein
MAIKNLPGFVRVYKGKQDPVTGDIAKTRYAINPLTGEKLTEREIQTRQHGGKPYEERVPESARKQYKLRELPPQGDALVRDFIDMKSREGVILTEREARASKEYKDIVRALKYKSNKPDGAKAQALIKLGRRAPEYDWFVGDTPTEDAA